MKNIKISAHPAKVVPTLGALDMVTPILLLNRGSAARAVLGNVGYYTLHILQLLHSLHIILHILEVFHIFHIILHILKVLHILHMAIHSHPCH